jgi:membrane complex biogenesis BtpA family protein
MRSLYFPFTGDRTLIGTVHLLPLPGSPGFGGDLDVVREAALRDARAFKQGGVDALIVENFGDAPFLPGRVQPHTAAVMTLIAREVADASALPIGINVLRNDGIAALGIARAVGATFVRVNVFTGVVATDQGIIQGEAHNLLRYRSLIGSDAAILADVHVKHGRPLDGDDIVQAAEEAYRRGRADALVVTGPASGASPASADLEALKKALPDAPLVAGSGLDPDNASRIFKHARAAIVGTWCKKGGDITAPVDVDRVSRLVQSVRAL